MVDPDELITIYEAENVTEAYFVKNLLSDEGIEASVAEENSLGLNLTPSDVLVRRRDEARARTVVDEYDDEQVRRAARPDWSCPACRATVIGAFDLCDACGAARPGTEEEDMQE